MIMAKSEIIFDILFIEGTYNTRDMGGHINKNGQFLNKRKFIRSASLSGITEEGKKYVYNLGIDCIIDLRTSCETQIDPSSFINDSKIKYIHAPLKDYIYDYMKKTDKTSFPNSMSQIYIWIIENNKNMIKRILNICANEKYSTILFHCASGKDRTGLLAMLLFSIAEVDLKIIFEDYCISSELLKTVTIHKRNKVLPAYFGEIEQKTMECTITYLVNKYGSVINYATDIGINEYQLKVIKNKFIRY
ncbi:tyrosine-protein phosphatase [Clostridium beijerinckii]|uniref:tyrosine-protein phosphatase n=1 Tax=Clostridium beijerinckii TaxID=1520 RepID=UPI00098C2026|nr:tyrosine-protein phosphatase [Clostridium beijerinckii]MBA8932424.1 protein-tyrosine phosphatase [Clostridium beijerinckii]NRU36628.1 protein-tyrosine phosphatase [Clostridium beijerinckii]NRZ23053.1 protein-tyrosine phosphatase [Clostridium beijerinckii]NSB00094.1 protein-tyrosine phosphatase [Clostridium beijerinckii]OOM65445.1 tyrosine-protein phosphatase precursor [Clostridium beijerinckii]